MIYHIFYIKIIIYDYQDNIFINIIMSRYRNFTLY